jgi:hypothetical protein
MTIQAIQTNYAGHLFRSRLEARWAVFLDDLRVPWRYESEGFDLDGLAYLPDFWLPVQRCWLEVKPRAVETPADWEKCRRLAAASGRPVFMLSDEFYPMHLASGDASAEDVRGSQRGWHPPGYGYARHRPDVDFVDGCCEWAVCPLCGAAGVDHFGQHPGCDCRCTDGRTRTVRRTSRNFTRPVIYCASCPECLDREGEGRAFPHRTQKDSFHPRLLAAYAAARSARFEHGETPTPPPESEVLP